MTLRQRGFTLVELLVTFVIAGLVGMLLWQALAQVAGLETRLAGERLLASQDQLRRAWVHDALAGVISGPTGDPRGFAGSPARLQTYTTRPPSTLVHGPSWTEWELQTEAGRSVLRVDGQPLWSWEGRGRFEFLDRAGVWHQHWPVPDADRPALPLAVRLVGVPGGTLMAAIAADHNPMLRRSDVLADEARR